MGNVDHLVRIQHPVCMWFNQILTEPFIVCSVAPTRWKILLGAHKPRQSSCRARQDPGPIVSMHHTFSKCSISPTGTEDSTIEACKSSLCVFFLKITFSATTAQADGPRARNPPLSPLPSTPSTTLATMTPAELAQWIPPARPQPPRYTPHHHLHGPLRNKLSKGGCGAKAGLTIWFLFKPHNYCLAKLRGSLRLETTDYSPDYSRFTLYIITLYHYLERHTLC
ncbi:hypothetical protein B0T25DRAFT_151477 [Lasiosphaeria hispida]|uniref:Uncharacterized protein n=1 Tax=Lasiosphaeria hispida TaxID=260671 RepID=A0AAJ0HLT3_9PEZI|nr:hypothetical protein B0T25DRAFT_151477 [Lasiosphaeria hispida]